jgi:hypothetical protein
MPDYMFEFTAHIDERKRPEGFPKEVRIVEQYNGLESDEQVKDLYNARVKVMIGNPGIVTFIDPNKIIDTTSLSFDQRIFIPWHMITYFHGRVKIIQQSRAMQDEMALPEMPPTSKKETVQ